MKRSHVEQPETDAAHRRDAMYRTAFGFAEAGAPPATTRAGARRPLVLGISMLPLAASAIYGAISPTHVRQVWLFSCHLFGH